MGMRKMALGIVVVVAVVVVAATLREQSSLTRFDQAMKKVLDPLAAEADAAKNDPKAMAAFYEKLPEYRKQLQAVPDASGYRKSLKSDVLANVQSMIADYKRNPVSVVDPEVFAGVVESLKSQLERLEHGPEGDEGHDH